MAEQQVLGWGTQNAPAQRTNDGRNEWALLAIDATFNGTGAAASFVPAVQIISDAGEEVGVFPADRTLSVGDSASITFAPFLRSGGAGVKFDTKPQQGTYLYFTLTGTEPASGNGWFVDSTHTIALQSEDEVALQSSNASVTLNGDVLVNGTGSVTMQPATDVQLIPTGDVRIGGSNVIVEPSVEVDINLQAGQQLIVNIAGTGDVFQIASDGNLHGKTGKTLTFDL